jgi:Sigma-70 region 2
MMGVVLATTEAAFTTLAESHRRELHVHCCRMLGSFEEAEDLVQETLLRAWRNRERAWRHQGGPCTDHRRRAHRAGLGPGVARRMAAPPDAGKPPTGGRQLFRAPGDSTFRAFKIEVLRFRGSSIAEITTFDARLFEAFGLPPTL